MSLASVVPTQVQWTRKEKRWNCAINQLQSSSQGLCSLHLSSAKQCSEWKVENNIEVRGRGINIPGLKFPDQTNLVHRLTLLCLCRSVYKIGTKSNVKKTPCLLKTLWSQRFSLIHDNRPLCTPPTIDGIKHGDVIWSVLEGKQLIKTAKTIVYPGPQEMVNF